MDDRIFPANAINAGSFDYHRKYIIYNQLVIQYTALCCYLTPHTSLFHWQIKENAEVGSIDYGRLQAFLFKVDDTFRM